MNAASFADPGSSVPCGGLGASRWRSGEGGGRIRTPWRRRSLCNAAGAHAGPGAASWMTHPRSPPRPSLAALLSKCLVLPRAGLDWDQAAGEDTPCSPLGPGRRGPVSSHPPSPPPCRGQDALPRRAAAAVPLSGRAAQSGYLMAGVISARKEDTGKVPQPRVLSPPMGEPR